MRQLQTNEHKWIITVMQRDTKVWVQSKIPEPYIFKVSTCNQSRVVLCFKIVLLQLSCLFLVAVQISKDLITLRQASAHPQVNMHSQTLKFWCPKLYGCNCWANDCLTCRILHSQYFLRLWKMRIQSLFLWWFWNTFFRIWESVLYCSIAHD